MTKISYEVIRSKRKTMAIQVKGDGSVAVRCPLWVSDREAEEFVNRHREWICRHRQEVLEKQKAKTVLTRRQAEEYRRHARWMLAQKTWQWAEKMGVSYGRLTIRSQATRWGSCSGKGNLNFNWKLALLPEELVDYVVVHELAHRKEMNHSERFWRLVAQVLPDYQERKQWLKENGDLLMSGVVFRGSYFSQGGVPKDTLWKKGSPDLGFRMQKL